MSLTTSGVAVAVKANTGTVSFSILRISAISK